MKNKRSVVKPNNWSTKTSTVRFWCLSPRISWHYSATTITKRNMAYTGSQHSNYFRITDVYANWPIIISVIDYRNRKLCGNSLCHCQQLLEEKKRASLHLCLGKEDMLVYSGVVLAEFEFLCDPPRILSFNIKESSTSGWDQTDKYWSTLGLTHLHCKCMM